MKRLLVAIIVLATLLAASVNAADFREDTAVTIMFQMVDVTDGHTPETGLTIAAADVLISKNYGTWAAKSDTTAPAHVASGWYSCVLNATDVGTAGSLLIRIANQPTARMGDPNYVEHRILCQDWYDLQTGAASFMTTAQSAAAVQTGMTAQGATTTRMASLDTTGTNAAAAKTAAEATQTDWANGGRLDLILDAIYTLADKILKTLRY